MCTQPGTHCLLWMRANAGETGETDRSQMVVTVITGWIPNVLLPMTLKKWHLKAVPPTILHGAQYLISYCLPRNP